MLGCCRGWWLASSAAQNLIICRHYTTATTAATLQLQSLVKHNELASDCCLVVLVLAIKTWNNQLHPHHQPSNCSLRGRVTILVSSSYLYLRHSACVVLLSPCPGIIKQ